MADGVGRLGAALALVGRVRQMALRRRNAQLEHLVAERTELGVVRKLVLRYGGTVEVHSVVGQGTRFTLTLPRGGARSIG